jgi:hypothetical protein
VRFKASTSQIGEETALRLGDPEATRVDPVAVNGKICAGACSILTLEPIEAQFINEHTLSSSAAVMTFADAPE